MTAAIFISVTIAASIFILEMIVADFIPGTFADILDFRDDGGNFELVTITVVGLVYVTYFAYGGRWYLVM